MANGLRRPGAGLIAHSDRELARYTSAAYTDRLEDFANAIFEYIEIFHNRRRRHSNLGMRTPIEFELLNTASQAA
jgi:transposase InsO family protein